mgnify:CR=1 FL=1
MEGSSEECADCYSQPDMRTVKARIAAGLMKELHKAFFTEFLEGGFMRPPRVNKPQSVHKSQDGSTVDSLEPKVQTKAVEEWKINLITTLLLNFEERCLTDRVLNEEALRVFRSLNRGLLGKVLEHIEEFKSQKYSSLACSILMINSSKVKIPKEDFIRIISGFEVMDRLHLTSIAAIKKSKVFSLLKSVLKE